MPVKQWFDLTLTHENGTEAVRNFIVSESFAQYQAGNVAGIHWMRHGKTKASELVNE